MGASFFSDLFNKPVGGVIGPINAAGQTVVAKLVDKVEPDMKDFAAQRDSIIQNLKQKKSQERDELFTDSIVEKLVKEGKIKYHKDVFNQILQHYRAS
jgi:parvulin-like peptidyl-prolyl isomerase